MTAAIDDLVARFAAIEEYPAVAAGVLIDGTLAHTATAGVAETQASGRTLFQIGSISKTFTAVAVLRLRDRERLRLDDPVVRHLPEFAGVRNPFGPVEDITLRRLLLHRSGLQAEPFVDDPSAMPYLTQAEVVASLPDARIRIPPDSAFKYSNLGYRVLAEVVARVAGQSFAEHLHEDVIAPLGLARTTAATPVGELAGACARGHGPRELGSRPVAAVDSARMDGDGGVWSCVEDLATWLGAQLDGAGVIAPTTIAELQRPVALTDGDWREARTLGWAAVRRGGDVLLGHSGLVEGFDAYACFSVARRSGAIVLANALGRTGTEELAWCLMDLLPGDAAWPHPGGRAPMDDGGHELAGTYRSPYGRVVRIEARDGGMVRVGATVAPLRPGPDPLRFTLPWPDGEEVRFWRDARGGVAGLNEAGDAHQRTDGPPPAPVAKVVPHVQVVHGRSLPDEYAWMRDSGDPDVRRYLDAENRHADRALAHLAPLRERLERELERPVAGREDQAPALDVEQVAACHRFARIGRVEPSDDGALVAYTLDLDGDERYALGILDPGTGATLLRDGPDVQSLAWLAGDVLLFVELGSAPRRGTRLWSLDARSGARTLLHEETDAMNDLDVRRSSGGDVVLLHVTRYADAPRGAVEIRCARAAEPLVWETPIARCDGIQGVADQMGEHLYLRVDDRGPWGRVVRARTGAAARMEWEELLPCRPGVTLGELRPLRDHLVVLERRDGLPGATVLDLRTGEPHALPLPSGPGAVRVPCATADGTVLRYERTSLVDPPATVEYDPAARAEFVRPATVAGYVRERFEAVRLTAPAPDGTSIPVDLVRLRASAADDRRGILLEGYGCYGGAMDPRFDTDRLPLLERGVAVAIAHPRGGGEFGAPWHDAGRGLAKRTTFEDFIAVAEHFVAAGYAPPGRLVIRGASAGGALVTGVAQMRPDLFAGVVALVPFADPLHVQLDDTMPFAVLERPEWGDPRASVEEFEYLAAYCPYTTLAARSYPAMYVTASLHDGQVPYWQPARYVARQRRLRTGTAPLVLRTNLHAGHHGSSRPEAARRERAEELAFVLDRLGLA